MIENCPVKVSGRETSPEISSRLQAISPSPPSVRGPVTLVLMIHFGPGLDPVAISCPPGKIVDANSSPPKTSLWTVPIS